jgi:hypothetical protein
LFLAISKASIMGSEAPKTVRFSGSIQNIPATILIDSGSSASFISCKLAQQLFGLVPLTHQVSVQVAGGGILSCSAVIPQALWFQSDLKVLPLTAYDIIVGMDWLEAFSPMKVHWQRKWMEIPYKGHCVKLQGLVPRGESGSDRIISLPHPHPYFFVGCGAKQIFHG